VAAEGRNIPAMSKVDERNSSQRLAIVTRATTEIGRRSDVRVGKIVDQAMAEFERDFTRINSPSMRATIMEKQFGITPTSEAGRTKSVRSVGSWLMHILHLG
jgi:hypothetical protein